MFKGLVGTIIRIVAQLIDGWLARTNPTIEAYVKEAAVLAVDIVEAAEATGAPGEQKKAEAVAQLKADMLKHGLDLPGDMEDHVAGAVVEGAVSVLKAKGGSFFAGLSKLQLG